LAVAIGLVSLPMTWLHVYAESRRVNAFQNLSVDDAVGYSASMDLYGFDVVLWLPVSISIVLAMFFVLRGYDLVSLNRWKTDSMAVLVAASILLPLWPCYSGTCYPGLGWYFGALCAVLVVSEYVTKFRNEFPK
jgi:hypothetical protein